MKLPPPPRLRSRLSFEQLEDRTTPTSSTVTTLLDVVNDSDGVISLREAILAAEADPEPDTIDFDPSLTKGTILLETFDSGLESDEAGPTAFRITTPIDIQGTGQVLLRNAQSGAFRLFYVSGQLTLSNLELRGGLAKGGDGVDGGGGAAGLGGAILNRGEVRIYNSLLVGNSAIGGIGSILGEEFAGGGGGLGESASGEFGGGPNGGDGEIGSGFGGGGAGASGEANGGDGGFGGGGGSSFFFRGGDGGFGGGGGASGGGEENSFGGFGALDGSTFAGGDGAGLGGAIFNYGGELSLVNTTVTANIALGGFSGNNAVRAAGIGGFNLNGGAAGLGGGVFNLNGYAFVVNSTFHANQADAGGSLFNLSHDDTQGIESFQSAFASLVNSIFENSVNADLEPSANEVYNVYVDNFQSGGSFLATIVAEQPNISNGGGFFNENGDLFDDGVITEQGSAISAALADNGGFTRTLALSDTSSALDIGDNDGAIDPNTESGLETDQRGPGFPRIVNGTVDLGAFERSSTVTRQPDTIVITGPTFTIVQNGPQGQGNPPDPFPGFDGENRVAVGDINNDGTVDYIFSAGDLGGPHIKVISGADGSLLYNFFAYDPNFRGGVYVATGDLDGDGFWDIVTGAGERGGPHIRAFSGKNGSLLANFFGYDIGHRSGITVAVGDVNGDTTPDIIAGSGPGDGSEVRIFDGTKLNDRDSQGVILPSGIHASFFAYPGDYRDGVFVAAGNLNGDQFADIVAGPLVRGITTQTVVFTGPTLQKVSSFFADDPSLFVGLRFTVADADGDGIEELIVVAAPGGGPRKIVVNPLTGEQISNEFFFDPNSRTGFSVG